MRVLSRVFRGSSWRACGPPRSGATAGLCGPVAFAAWAGSLYEADWVVYAQPPAPSPEVVLKYLALREPSGLE